MTLSPLTLLRLNISDDEKLAALQPSGYLPNEKYRTIVQATTISVTGSARSAKSNEGQYTVSWDDVVFEADLLKSQKSISITFLN
jgi:hypothetical protein